MDTLNGHNILSTSVEPTKHGYVLVSWSSAPVEGRPSWFGNSLIVPWLSKGAPDDCSAAGITSAPARARSRRGRPADEVL